MVMMPTSRSCVCVTRSLTGKTSSARWLDSVDYDRLFFTTVEINRRTSPRRARADCGGSAMLNWLGKNGETLVYGAFGLVYLIVLMVWLVTESSCLVHGVAATATVFDMEIEQAGFDNYDQFGRGGNSVYNHH